MSPSANVARVARALLACGAFFVVRGVFGVGDVLPAARAGEQLSTAELVRRAEAIAVVDNTLDRKGAATSWLRPASPDAPPALPAGTLAGVCVPDKALLRQWLASHKSHPGRATWTAALAAGHVEQVVFLKTYGGKLQPTCETEVMLGRSFALHPDYPAFRAELDALLRPAPAPPPPAPVAPPAAPPPSTSPAPPPLSPPPSSGCL